MPKFLKNFRPAAPAATVALELRGGLRPEPGPHAAAEVEAGEEDHAVRMGTAGDGRDAALERAARPAAQVDQHLQVERVHLLHDRPPPRRGESRPVVAVDRRRPGSGRAAPRGTRRPAWSGACSPRRSTPARRPAGPAAAPRSSRRTAIAARTAMPAARTAHRLPLMPAPQLVPAPAGRAARGARLRPAALLARRSRRPAGPAALLARRSRRPAGPAGAGLPARRPRGFRRSQAVSRILYRAPRPLARRPATTIPLAPPSPGGIERPTRRPRTGRPAGASLFGLAPCGV